MKKEIIFLTSFFTAISVWANRSQHLHSSSSCWINLRLHRQQPDRYSNTWLWSISSTSSRGTERWNLNCWFYKNEADVFSYLLTRPVSFYPPSSSHSPSLSLFHPLFFPLWVCSLQTKGKYFYCHFVFVAFVKVIGETVWWCCCFTEKATGAFNYACLILKKTCPVLTPPQIKLCQKNCLMTDFLTLLIRNMNITFLANALI